MGLLDLDHVNIRTNNLAALAAFYETVLGLEPGERPPFNIGGAWLYCGAKAAVHLVEVSETPDSPKPRIEHFAFKAEGLEQFLTHLRAHKVPYWISIVPGNENRQVNVRDPDGNHIEIQFAGQEQADLSNYAGEA